MIFLKPQLLSKSRGSQNRIFINLNKRRKLVFQVDYILDLTKRFLSFRARNYDPISRISSLHTTSFILS